MNNFLVAGATQIDKGLGGKIGLSRIILKRSEVLARKLITLRRVWGRLYEDLRRTWLSAVAVETPFQRKSYNSTSLMEIPRQASKPAP
jgi:hypothetical protein